jgi:RNA polymerase sigma factor (sigma-70 family)
MRWIPSALLTPLCLALLLVGPAPAEGPDTTAADEQILKDAKLSADGPALLELLRKRTVTDTDLEKVKALIRQLGDDSFSVRQKASNDLVEVGPAAVPLLKQALTNPDVEVVRRAEECLRQINETQSAAVAAAAARLIAVRKPPGAVEVLLAYLPSADDEYVAEAVRNALASLSEGERSAIELAYFGGHTYREVATLLEQPEGTVKSRIRSGLLRLRAALIEAGILE